jgi:hypothetical protein
LTTEACKDLGRRRDEVGFGQRSVEALLKAIEAEEASAFAADCLPPHGADLDRDPHLTNERARRERHHGVPLRLKAMSWRTIAQEVSASRSRSSGQGRELIHSISAKAIVCRAEQNSACAGFGKTHGGPGGWRVM